MVYIVVINPKGFEDFEQEQVFDTYEDALNYMTQFELCQGNDLDYRLYEAINEYTSKRKLLLKE